MSDFETAAIAEAYESVGQDRWAVCKTSDGLVIVVADGAGGFRMGGLAADQVVRDVRIATPPATSADDWASQLERIDHSIDDGKSTGVIVSLTNNGNIWCQRW